MPKLDLDSVEQSNAHGYPAELSSLMEGRQYRNLSPTAGINDFGVSQVVLAPGAWSAQRHWHEKEDEFVVIVFGVAVLLDNDGETMMEPGDCAAFPKNDGNGHCLINRSEEPCVFFVVGQRVNGPCHFPDVDVHDFGEQGKARKDGSPF